MNRRQFLFGSVMALGAASTFVLKPSDEGAHYSSYFKQLNGELAENGPYKPSLLVDLDTLRRNIDALQNRINPHVHYRVVAKSLPSLPLLDYAMNAANTNRLMVFHQPFLNQVAEKFPETDILLGKPLPVTAAEKFYRKLGKTNDFDPSIQLQWLIDTRERLHQYQTLAKQLGTKMRINIEIDVGLHRGGLQNPVELKYLLDQILADPAHLQFAGLMGYDAHVVKLPGIIKSQEAAYQESQFIYREFLRTIQSDYPKVDTKRLCLNGAGSPTIALHQQGSVVNEVSAGSCLVKPVDFDIPSLEAFRPAAFISTPILKKLDHVTIPAIEKTKEFFSWWDPNMEQSYFIYGGKWMAQYESPKGLRDNPLYGPSTNQHMITGSKNTGLKVDDHVFLRPNQSEFVFLQFGDLLAIQKGKIVDKWPVLSES